MRPTRGTLAFVAGLLLLGALPVVRHWAWRPPPGRCALDGVAIDPPYRVRVHDARGRDHEFCCVRCAELWLGRRREPPRAAFVTDEATGGEIDAAQAHFVRSSVVTTPTTGNRVHAFASPADAARHAEVARGRLLTGPERPFQEESNPDVRVH
jgi:hypothetical protein